MIAVPQGVTDIFLQHDGSCCSLPSGGIIWSFQYMQIGDTTLQAVKWIHHRDGNLPCKASSLIRHDDFGDACRQLLGPNAKDMAQKINTDGYPVHHRLNDRGFGCLIVDPWDKQLASERLRQLLRGFTPSKIVDILGSIWAVEMKLFRCGIEFRPEVQCLSADDECAILQNKMGSNIENGGWI